MSSSPPLELRRRTVWIRDELRVKELLQKRRMVKRKKRGKESRFSVGGKYKSNVFVPVPDVSDQLRWE